MFGTTKKEGALINDAKITLQIKLKLAMEKSIPLTKINVKTVDGIVFLEGVLDSKSQAIFAVIIAELINGVKSVNTTNLKIAGCQQNLTDTYLTAKVKGLFLKEKLFGKKPDTNIKVEVKNGVAYLYGKITDNNFEKDAINLAKKIEGITAVVSKLIIK